MAYRTLILRHVTGRRHRHDYDVFDGDRDVGCIYLVDAYGRWFWGSNFQMTGTKSYGFATSLDAAKTAFKAQYLAWKSGSDARLTEAKKLAGHRRPRASA